MPDCEAGKHHVSYFHRTSNAQGTGSHREGTLPRKQGTNSPVLLLGCKILISTMFFMVVLISSVLNKLTLVRLTDSLRNGSEVFTTSSDPPKWSEANASQMIEVYWQIVLVLLVPNVLTFLRSLFFGTLGKAAKNYPWPLGRAIALVSVGA